MRFTTTVIQSGKTACGVRVPPEIVAALGHGQRPAVTVTVNGFTWRSTVAVYGEEYWLGVSAENRAGSGAAAGDTVDIDVEFDAAPREIAVPEDLAAALAAEPDAERAFAALSYSRKQFFVLPIEAAKAPDTRARRIEKTVETLRSGGGRR